MDEDFLLLLESDLLLLRLLSTLQAYPLVHTWRQITFSPATRMEKLLA